MKPQFRFRIAALGVAGMVAVPGAVTGQSAPSPLWGSLESGPHGVGFTAQFVTDASRTFDLDGDGSSATAGRPIRVFLWYPTDAGISDERMTFGDYLNVMPDDSSYEAFARYLHDRDMDTAARQFSPLSEQLLGQLLATPVAAVRSPQAAEGRLPLVIHTLGLNNFQQESTVLWEFLASYGYVIAVVPQLSTGSQESPEFEPGSIALQADDLAFTLDHLLATEPPTWTADLGIQIDGNRVGLIGHSSGGIVALAQSDRDDRVSAVVGLDASFVTEEGGALMAVMEIDLESISASVLNLFARTKRDQDPTVLGRMHLSNRYHVTLGGTRPPVIATHFDFQNWPLYSVLTGVEDDRGVGARPSDQASLFFYSACRLTLHFLDHVFMENEASRAYLTGENPLPEIDAELVGSRSELH